MFVKSADGLHFGVTRDSVILLNKVCCYENTFTERFEMANVNLAVSQK